MSATSATEAFKRSFVETLASRGLTPSMVEQVMDKQAAGLAGRLAAGGGALMSSVGALSTAGKTLLGAYLAAPVIAGGALGYGMGNVEGVEPPDIKALQEKERINNIRRAIKSLRRQQGLLV